ncbi:MAG TPA: hypothetical protein PLL10_02070 [Elusimicrobiales bacterium]|nr:hypothetical protein [Elusimicrobiales bacterium]
MFVTIFTLAGLLAGMAHAFQRRKELDRQGIAELLLLYVLVFGVGISGTMAGLGHIFNGPEIARKIGWEPGSPFQFEVGMHDFAWGVLGLLSLRYKGGFRAATALGWSIFLFGAGLGHLRETLQKGNYAPYNFGMIAPDLVIPAILLTLLFLRRKTVS